MQNLNIVFANKYIFISLLVFVSVLIYTFRLYSKKSFSNVVSLRNILLFFRLSSVTLIFFVLLRPGCSFNRVKKIKPKCLILIDNSKSIKYNNDFNKRKIISIVKNIESKLNNNDFNYSLLTFGDSIKTINDLNQLTFDDNNTNFIDVLSYIENNYVIENLSNIFVITDGNFERSQIIADFIKKIKPNFYFIPIGDSIKSPDLKINYIKYDKDAYLNKKHDFKVNISVLNVKSKQISLKIFDSNKKLIKEEIIRDFKDNIILEKNIAIVPNKLGKEYYTFVLSSDEKEKNILNNKFILSINVRKSKLKVLMLWGYPDLDFKFLKETFLDNTSLFLNPFILSNPEDKYNFMKMTHKISEFDLILLGKISIMDLRESVWDSIEKYIYKLKKPVVIFTGFNNRSLLTLKRTKIGKIIDYIKSQDVLSLDFRKPVLFIPNYLQENNFFNIYSLESKNIEYWNNMPQITESFIIKRLPDFIKILGSIRYNDMDYPSVFLNQKDGINVLFFGISGIWRWKFAILSLGFNNLEFDNIFNNMIRYLVYSDNSKLIHVAPVKEIAKSNEGVIFSGNINNIITKKFYNEYINLKIIDTTNTELVDVKLKKDKNGQYYYMNNKLHVGKYRYIIDYYVDDKLRNTKKGIFYITEEKKEFDNSFTNLSYLNYMANNRNVFIADNDSILNKLSIEGNIKKIMEEKHIYLWDNFYLYLFIILFLAIEWFIREKNLLL